MAGMLGRSAGGATPPCEDAEGMAASPLQQRRLAAGEFPHAVRALADDPEAAWRELAGRYLAWAEAPLQAQVGSFATGGVRWFPDGRLNVTVSCLDRHLALRPDADALLAVGDDPDALVRWSFRDLHDRVCRAAGALAALGVGAGDTVGICLPTIPEAAVAMLACARIGAVHGVVFAGFGAEALAQRWNDLGCAVAVTADVVRRGGRVIPLKATVDEALARCPRVRALLVVRRGADTAWDTRRDHDWHAALARAAPEHAPWLGPGDAPLFALHTSGSTGRPKGLVHAAAGFLLHAALTHQATVGYCEGDRYACLADLGWITGHAYALYGPLANGAPAFLDEGTPLFPAPDRYWRLAERFALDALFTVPTALRLIAAHAPRPPAGVELSRLRLIACAGEVLDPAVHAWLGATLPQVRLVNIYGQTEAAGHLLAGAPEGPPLGVGLLPCPGIAAALLDDAGRELTGAGSGRLVVTRPWPGLAVTVLGDHERYVRSYLAPAPGCYATGDLASRDRSGVYLIHGRDDDVVNVAGHRVAPAELEAIARALPGVADAAAAGVPDALRGSALVLFVVPVVPDAGLCERVRAAVRTGLGAFAAPRAVVAVAALPRTRSGKPLRRLLAACVTGEDPGDLSTLADATAVDDLRRAWAAYSKGLSGLPTASPGR
jgi:acetyl-CoA synthetase